MSLLSLRGVGRTYTRGPETVQALRSVDLEVDAGGITAIVGASGSGKTTLLNIAGGVDRPSTGEVWLDGVRIDGCSEAKLTAMRRGRVGMIFQDFFLIPELTALENVRLPLLFSGGDTDPMEMLARTEIADRSSFYPHQLSGGEQQRVAIARALIHRPRLLLADEPTGNLDSKQAGRFFELFASLSQDDGLAILLATHNEDLAMRAGRAMRLADGILGPMDGSR